MNEKDDRIEGFGEDMKIRETELVEVYWKDWIYILYILYFF